MTYPQQTQGGWPGAPAGPPQDQQWGPAQGYAPPQQGQQYVAPGQPYAQTGGPVQGYAGPPQGQQWGPPPGQGWGPPQGQQWGPPPQQQEAPPAPRVTGTIDAFLSQPSTGGGWPLQFETAGTWYLGIVNREITDGDIEQQTEMNDNTKLATFKDGRPKWVMRVPLNIRPTQQCQDGKAQWYCRGSAKDLLTAAMQGVGAPNPGVPEFGSMVYVALTGTRPSGKGMSPQKTYDVRYYRPEQARQLAAEAGIEVPTFPNPPAVPDAPPEQMPPVPTGPPPGQPQPEQPQQGQAPQWVPPAAAQNGQQGPPPGQWQPPQGQPAGPPAGAPQGPPPGAPAGPPAGQWQPPQPSGPPAGFIPQGQPPAGYGQAPTQGPPPDIAAQLAAMAGYGQPQQ